MENRKLILNSVICLECGETLISHHRHDYQTCLCFQGTFVDGGNEYQRYGGKDLAKVKDNCIYSDAPFEVLRETIERGSYGISNKEKLKYIKLKDISDEYLQNIIIYEETLRPNNPYLPFYKREVLYRKYVNLFNKKMINNSGDVFFIIECFNKKQCTIQFEDGTILKDKDYKDLLRGSIKNPNKPIFYGVGYIGQGNYTSSVNKNKTLYYQCWLDMLKRCYSGKITTYKETTVTEEWHNFQNFAQWYEDNYKEGFHLDKDILVKGNKIYSPETCCFVPRKINTAVINTSRNKKELPIGIRKDGNKYVVRISKYNRRVYLGIFNTLEQAFQAYKIAKEAYIKELANKYKNQITEACYEALYNYQVEITD